MRRDLVFAPVPLAIVGLIAILVVAAPAGALQYNIDFEAGEPSPDNYGTPSPSYAAASPAGGVWNPVSVLLGGEALPLVDDSGADTGVTIDFPGAGGARRWNNPSTTGDDEALLDDGYFLDMELDAVAVITLSGLPAGLWDVYTYAWDPSFGDERSTLVDVNGTGTQLIDPTSEIFSGFIQGETHLIHSVTIAPGEDIVITAMNNDDGFDQSTINGLQIVAVDVSPVVPGSWGALKSAFGD